MILYFSFALAAAMAMSALADEIFVSSAASLTDALKEVAARFEKQTGTKVVLNFGASSLLARQIEENAPVDVFISADEAQMDRVQKEIAPESRTDLLTNKLVVIVRQDSALHLDNLEDLVKPECGRIALADSKAVPAGVYAREVLTKAGLWEKVEAKVVPTENVRATLAVVEVGNADAGFVYKTDAMTSSFGNRNTLKHGSTESSLWMMQINLIAEYGSMADKSAVCAINRHLQMIGFCC